LKLGFVIFQSKLNPKPSEADFFSLIKIATDSFFSLLPPTADEKPVSALTAL
jgi:hypothetical protein